MTSSQNPEHELEILTGKLQHLTMVCHRLRLENQQLKEQVAHLTTERDQYSARTQSARKRVEQMLERLQSLSQQI